MAVLPVIIGRISKPLQGPVKLQCPPKDGCKLPNGSVQGGGLETLLWNL